MVKKKNSVEKNIFIVFLTIVLFLCGVVVAPYLYHEIFNKFSYAGIEWEKIKDNKITFYHGIFPVIYQGNFQHYLNLYFRTDPRKNNVSVNVSEFQLSKNIRISFDEGAISCSEQAILGQSVIGQFFGAFPWVKDIKTGMNDPVAANNSGLSYYTCEDAGISTTVLIMQKSEEPSIQMGTTENCYIFNVGECENLKVTEKYIATTIAQINNVTI